jgi:hypothetical protein
MHWQTVHKQDARIEQRPKLIKFLSVPNETRNKNNTLDTKATSEA